eukprot:1201918-Lingulodinium_polyedra.AAC.1
MSAQSATVLWPEMNMLKLVADDKKWLEALDTQWLGSLLLEGMVVRSSASEPWSLSLGSVERCGALLWPL